jgi:hypothetical protein
VVTYSPRDVVTYNGTTWIATTSSYNLAPSTTNAAWQVMVAPAPGTPSTPGISGLQYVSQTVSAALGPNRYSMNCPSGTRAIGGGYSLPAGTTAVTVTGSMPEDSTVATNRYSRWTVSTTVTGTTVQPVQVYAICAIAP